MSLDWSYAEMKERLGEEEFDRITTNPNAEDEWHPVSLQLIWSCLFIDMNGIQENNWEQFADRLQRYQDAFGGLIRINGELAHITREQVKQHIGLRTNVITLPERDFAAKLEKRGD